MSTTSSSDSSEGLEGQVSEWLENALHEQIATLRKQLAMETAAAAATPAAKKRRTEAHERRESEAALTPPPHELLPTRDAHSGPEPKGPGQEPRRGDGGEEYDGVDRISLLPDALLGEIVSLLPTKDAARTQTLASRWRDVWLSSPLNLDCSGGDLYADGEVEAEIISQILVEHKGPVRRLSVPVLHLHDSPEAVEAWLRLPALDNLQELEFYTEDSNFYHLFPDASLPISALRCSASLRVLTISECRIPESTGEVLCFPNLRQLGLADVQISTGLLNSIISACPVLECLLLRLHVLDFLRIVSPSLVSVCLYHFSGNLIIEDAPSLERLLHFGDTVHTDVNVISAPKLKTLGCLRRYCFKYTFGTTIIQELKVSSFKTEVRSVKILAIQIPGLCLDTVIDFIRFFPCLEILYTQASDRPAQKNLWRRKHRDLLKCLDIRLKTLVLKNYRAIGSHVNFATFFVLNAKRLELMRFECEAYSDNNNWIAKQHGLLQFEKRASICAKFYFTRTKCHSYFPHIKRVGDLSKTDPFECGPRCIF